MEDQSAHLDKLTSPGAPSRLRTRIMASSYRYQQLNEETYLDLDDDHAKSTSCFQSVSSLKRMLVVLLIVCIGLFIALIAVAAHDHSENYGDEMEDFEVCESAECIETSAYILAKMNMSVDPCEDMYQFSCGGWLDKTTPPSDQAKWDSFLDVGTANMKVLRRHLETDDTTFKGKNSSALSKLKMYYRTCMDKETIEARGTSRLIEIINSLGSWTVVSTANIDSWNNETWTLQSALVGMHHLMRSSLFGFDVIPDPKNTKRNIIMFSQSGLTLAHEGEYRGEGADKFKEAFLGFAVKVGSLLGGTEKDVRAKMTEVYNFEKKLSEIYVPKENMTNPLDLYNKMKLSDFQDLLGHWIDIKSYLRLSFYGHPFTKDEEVLVITPTYFKKIGPIIEKTDKEVLANYLMWNLIQSMTGYLPDAFSMAALPLAEVESGVKRLLPRWKRCLLKTEGVLGFASSLLFVNEKFAPEMKTKVVGALDKVRKEFIDNLGEVSWLDDKTRSTLKDKTKSLTNMVGYPDWLLDLKKLDERYDKLHVDEGEFLSNKIYAVDYKNRRILDKYGKAPDRTEWEMYPDVVNAYYSPTYNYVVVPAGILQPPFFTPDFPDAFLYGTIGMIVGHELTHGFDNQGRNYDKYGNLDNMWTAAAEDAFKDKSKCMVDQYGDFMLAGEHVNGKLTLGENIADNGGLKFGYRAYKSSAPSDHNKYQLPGLKLTNDQLYFLGFSQIWCAKLHEEYAVRALSTDAHSPNMYRVIGTLQNSYEFAKAFNCDANSFMNPKKKCRVW